MIFNENQPIYLQITDVIKKKIISGELKLGEKLFSVRDLASELKVNPNTVQRAYQELEREGIIYTQRGNGTFVVEDEGKINQLKDSMASTIVKDFLNNINDLGFSNEDAINLINRIHRGDNNG